jgi:hypothetical protein
MTTKKVKEQDKLAKKLLKKQGTEEEPGSLDGFLLQVEEMRAYRHLLYTMQHQLTNNYRHLTDDQRRAFDTIHSLLWERECQDLGIIMGFIQDPMTRLETRKRALRMFVSKYCAPKMSLDYIFPADEEERKATKQRMAKLAQVSFWVPEEEEE